MKSGAAQGTGNREQETAVAARRANLVFIGLLVSGALGLHGQQSRAIVRPGEVEYLFPEQVTVPAGQTSKVQLHFRVAQGLHINSHAPHEEFLIPTTLKIPEESGVKLSSADFPAGSDITLPSDPNQKLSVYTGEFTIDASLVAAKGDHLVEAKLHYQACNNSVCLPPKTITVPIDVVGK